MSLIIDGYNLLNSVGIVGRGSGPGGFERSRLALLNFLADTLPGKQVGRCAVVFDAVNAPPGLPRCIHHRGLVVHFAVGYPDADTMIEELIQADTSPRSLTVVSSDHRVQRAARRRKARAVDSDVWYAEILRHRAEASSSADASEPRPAVPLSASEVERWLEQFGGEASLAELTRREEEANRPAASKKRPKKKPSAAEPPTDKPSADESAGFANPFPPGYAEDLLADEDDLSDNPFPPGYGEDK